MPSRFLLAVVLILAAGPLCAADAEGRRAALIAELRGIQDLSTGDFLHLEPRGGPDAIIEIAKDGLEPDSPMLVMLGTYPPREDPLQTLPANGVPIPEGWTLRDWEAGVYAWFRAPAEDVERVATFVEHAFRGILGQPADFELIIGVDRLR